jgi:hypothetical protein
MIDHLAILFTDGSCSFSRLPEGAVPSQEELTQYVESVAIFTPEKGDVVRFATFDWQDVSGGEELFARHRAISIDGSGKVFFKPEEEEVVRANRHASSGMKRGFEYQGNRFSLSSNAQRNLLFYAQCCDKWPVHWPTADDKDTVSLSAEDFRIFLKAAFDALDAARGTAATRKRDARRGRPRRTPT